jgi:gluconokinase
VAENLQSNNVNGRPLENGVAIIVMGVSGSGKTTLGTLIARAIDANFYDADDYHDAPSVEKMRAGVPLTDQDRAPWLARLNDLLLTNIRAQRRVVLACSALKADYRHAILHDVPNARLILLDGGYETIAARMRKRSATTSHYMPEALLRSQFDTLERPNDAIVIDVGLSCDAQLECALASLK